MSTNCPFPVLLPVIHMRVLLRADKSLFEFVPWLNHLSILLCPRSPSLQASVVQPQSLLPLFSLFFHCKVTGVVMDSDGQAHYILSGTWDDKMESAKIVQSSRGSSSSEGKQKTVYQTLTPKLLWKKYPLPYVKYCKTHSRGQNVCSVLMSAL